MARAENAHVVGVQEGRWPSPARMLVDGCTVIAGPRDSTNVSGCQIWIANDIPLSTDKQRQSCIPPEAIQPILVE
eukprot:15435417-Alexandrium_andersonii.AAC.1